MALCIDIDRHAIEEGAKTLLGRRSRRAWQIALIVGIVSIPSVFAWISNGNDTVVEIGKVSYSHLGAYFVKAFATSIVALMFLVTLFIVQRLREQSLIKQLGAFWETESGGHGVVEILDNKIRYQLREKEIIFSYQDVEDLLEGENFSVLIYREPEKKQTVYIPIERTNEEFLNALKRITPSTSRSLY